MKYYLIAGEASGDLHGSNLMKSILKADAGASFRFFGGDLMASSGGTLVRHYKDLAYMGVWPVLTHLGTILRSAGQCFEDIRLWKPDVVILIDYPGFNLNMAKLVKKSLGIPVFYYISPKIWAWKSYRIKSMRKYVDELFSILPFEVDWFAARNYRIRYVGNPSVDSVEQFRSSMDRQNIGTEPSKPVIALLAGSRRTEIDRNLPAMLEATGNLDGYRIVIAAAPGVDCSTYNKYIGERNIEIVHDRTYCILEKARAALVTSGTATLETALFKVPQVVCYRMPVGPAVRIIRSIILKIPFISLVNLIAGRQVVPELVGGGMTPENIRNSFLPLLSDGPERQRQLEEYERLANLLGPAGASQNAANQIVALLEQKQTTK